jgi:P-type E1-E2 ATPase
MNFIGLMIFQNFLKHDTVEVLTRLRKANFKLKMISGDNSLTCVSAGKEASIVPKELNFVIMELSNELQVTVSEI